MISETPSLTPEQFEQIRDIIRAGFGISFAESDRNLVERRLGERLAELHLESFGPYVHLLAGGDRRELTRAIDVLTNNETYFFREDEQLGCFTREVLPDLRDRSAAAQSLSVWSAGCSSGEEVYTIAMLLLESGFFNGWRMRVFGSDVSSRMIARARRGLFGASAFRNTPSTVQRRHFRTTEDGWLVNDDLRAMCNFAMLNILDEDAVCVVGRFDVIFCRNVLMYFDAAAKERSIRVLYNRLNPGGVLLLGHTESLLTMTTDFEPLQLKNALVYRKVRDS